MKMHPLIITALAAFTISIGTSAIAQSTDNNLKQAADINKKSQPYLNEKKQRAIGTPEHWHKPHNKRKKHQPYLKEKEQRYINKKNQRFPDFDGPNKTNRP